VFGNDTLDGDVYYMFLFTRKKVCVSVLQIVRDAEVSFVVFLFEKGKERKFASVVSV